MKTYLNLVLWKFGFMMNYYSIGSLDPDDSNIKYFCSLRDHMIMPREQFGIPFINNNQNLQSNLNRYPKGVLKNEFDEIED